MKVKFVAVVNKGSSPRLVQRLRTVVLRLQHIATESHADLRRLLGALPDDLHGPAVREQEVFGDERKICCPIFGR